MEYKKILTIQDISCLGQCSLTVALPILSACGHETVILPSAVLSTHTGGSFRTSGFTFRDLTEDIPAIQKHWQKEGFTFDGIYTGYLGSIKQIDYVADIFDTMKKDGAPIICDPAMADNGNLYSIFDMDFVKAMTRLCTKADIILPNITEACLMTGYEYKEKYDEAYVKSLCKAMTDIGISTIILTGVSYDEKTTGIVVYEDGNYNYHCHERLPLTCHGTGDIFASAFTGAYLRGHSLLDAAGIAGDYVLKCIKCTAGDEEHWYGAKFEPVLGELIKALS
ncbi:MAG: pyridoxamine kinase [Lachnospiraceae bacterium]|nr:pyridoxamine kinase [Candidatus Equihabitans merdae]